jgi:hypothetical protein
VYRASALLCLAEDIIPVHGNRFAAGIMVRLIESAPSKRFGGATGHERACTRTGACRYSRLTAWYEAASAVGDVRRVCQDPPAAAGGPRSAVSCCLSDVPGWDRRRGTAHVPDRGVTVALAPLAGPGVEERGVPGLFLVEPEDRALSPLHNPPAQLLCLLLQQIHGGQLNGSVLN